MNFFKTKLVLMLIAAVVMTQAALPSITFAQGTSAEKPPSGGPRRQLGTIIYAGLGGAVLGLSTLSFYGRPQDKLANIAIGFAVGVIGGTVAVTYSAATNPDDFYGTSVDTNEIFREQRLGPAPTMTVVTNGSNVPNANAEALAPALSTSFELVTF